MTSKEYFRNLKIISIAMIMGIVTFICISLILNYNGDFFIDTGDFRNALLIIGFILFSASISASFFIFKHKINTLKHNAELAEKMSGYRSAIIIRFALIEGPAFFSIVAYLLTSEIAFIFLAALAIVFFTMAMPNKEKVKAQLELNGTECFKIDNPEEIICELNVGSEE